jgi:hypothetical protein
MWVRKIRNPGQNPGSEPGGSKSGSEIRVENPGQKSGFRTGFEIRKSGSEIWLGNPGRNPGSEPGGLKSGNPGRNPAWKSGSKIWEHYIKLMGADDSKTRLKYVYLVLTLE